MGECGQQAQPLHPGHIADGQGNAGKNAKLIFIGKIQSHKNKNLKFRI
jgi:hypothetical protein